MLEPLSCLLVVVAAIQTHGSVWSELDVAENDLDNHIYKNHRMGEEIYPPLPNSYRISSHQLDFTYNSGICDSIYNCATCDTVQLCQPTQKGSFVPFMTSVCPWHSPYCDPDTGTCTTMANVLCGFPDQFICPSDGYFPDAMNCSIYHVCRNYESEAFLCLSGVYDADNKLCVTNGTCITADCTDNSGKKMRLGSSHYYVTCISEDYALVNRCMGDYRLNFRSQNCEPICTGTGLIEDYFNCTLYYKCTVIRTRDGKISKRLQHLSCSKGFGFDPESYMCLPLYEIDCISTILEESVS